MRLIHQLSCLQRNLLLLCAVLLAGPLPAQQAVAIKCLWQKTGAGQEQYIVASGGRAETRVSQLSDPQVVWIVEDAGDFVRLKHQVSGGYLHNEHGAVEVGTIQPAWHSAQWKLVPAGENFRIQNRWKPTEHLNIEGPALASTAIQPNWLSAIWRTVPATGAAPPMEGAGGENTPAVTHSGAGALNQYIRSLTYDPREILAAQADGSTTTLPAGGTDRSQSGNAVIICKKVARKLDKKMEKISILKPSSGVLFPGALLLANERLAEGLPTPITLPRAPLTLRVDLPGLTNNGTTVVTNPTNSSVQSAINTVLEEWNRNPASEGYVNASSSISRIEKAYSSQQVSLELGFKADWASNSVSAATKMNTGSEQSVTVAFFQQVFYTISMDLPQQPANVFGPSVSEGNLRQVMNSRNPPAYVRSMDYGRTLMVRMETNKQHTEVDLEAALKYATAGGVELEGSLKAKYNSITNNSTFTVYSVGGNAEVATKVVGGTDLSGLRDVIAQNSVYTRDNPGVPISYTVAFLKDNEEALVGATSNYMETNCTEYPNGFVKLQHSGWYVGRFTVSWMEPNAQGVPTPQSWNSGEKTAGYSKTIELPGDATQVRIFGEAATGLVWDPWGEAINLTLNGPDNCTYTIEGTTLNRSYTKTACPET